MATQLQKSYTQRPNVDAPGATTENPFVSVSNSTGTGDYTGPVIVLAVTQTPLSASYSSLAVNDAIELHARLGDAISTAINGA